MSTDTSASAKDQCSRILAHLKTGATLTPIDALEKFGCFRLGARIWDLKKEGHDIRTRMIDINGKRVARYLLVYVGTGDSAAAFSVAHTDMGMF